MSEKSNAPTDAQHEEHSSPISSSSPRAILTVTAFFALPLSIVYLMSHCNLFTPYATSPYYRHSHPTLHAKQSLLLHVHDLVEEGPVARPTHHLQMQFCAEEGLSECTAYAYDAGCTAIADQRVFSIAEPSMFEGAYSACTVYRRGVHKCAMDSTDPESYKYVKEFVVNWEAKDERVEYAMDGIVPLLERGWISDIGSFECR